jgi:hypothetical protein
LSRRSNISNPLSSKNVPIISQLGFIAVLFSEPVEEIPQNASFALLYDRHLLSFSGSGEAMCMTERMSENEKWGAMTPF